MAPPTGKVVLAFDKFRGTATAAEVTEAAVLGAERAGWNPDPVPLADGGEGSLAAIGGANKHTMVAGPLGHPIRASWRLEGQFAYIEMASASGLALVGGPEGNDPLAADTTGTGQLISTAIELGARVVTVFHGGSASTDGGLGAVDALPTVARLKEIGIIAAVDVWTPFLDAARVFGPQKGASPRQVEMLDRRLQRLVQIYQERYGVDVTGVRGAGAAGGLAGGLLAVGGSISSGFDEVAEGAGLWDHLEEGSLVVTGEGYLDKESFNGKVVGGVAEWAWERGLATLAVVGDCDPDLRVPDAFHVVSLTDRYGRERAMAETEELVAEVVAERLAVSESWEWVAHPLRSPRRQR